jgi:hypothetical protein
VGRILEVEFGFVLTISMMNDSLSRSLGDEIAPGSFVPSVLPACGLGIVTGLLLARIVHHLTARGRGTGPAVRVAELQFRRPPAPAAIADTGATWIEKW